VKMYHNYVNIKKTEFTQVAKKTQH